MIKFGTYAWFGGHVNNDERFKAIKEAGFDSVALIYSNEYINEIGDKDSHIELAKKYNLDIENLHMPYTNAYDIFSDDELKAQKQLDIYRNGIDVASKNNIPSIVIHLTGDDVSDSINEKGLKRIANLIKYASMKNVNLAFENLRKNGIPYLYKVLDMFQDKNVGLCFDYGHAHCFLDDEFEVLRKYGDRLLVLHLHGNDGSWDYHQRLRDGTGDLAALKEQLGKLRFSCPYSLEVIQNTEIYNYQDLLKYLKEMKEDLEKLI